jgi:hypothetical protein
LRDWIWRGFGLAESIRRRVSNLVKNEGESDRAKVGGAHQDKTHCKFSLGSGDAKQTVGQHEKEVIFRADELQESLKAFGHAMSIPGNAALESALDPWFGLLWLEWV